MTVEPAAVAPPQQTQEIVVNDSHINAGYANFWVLREIVCAC